MDFEIFFEFLFEYFELKESSQAPRIPQGSAPELALNFLGLQNRFKIGPKIDQIFDVILDSFLVPLGSFLASLLALLAAQIGPNSAQEAPRSPQDAPRWP